MESLFANINLTEIVQKGSELAVLYVPKILFAILVFVLGSWIIKLIDRVLEKSMGFRKWDESLEKFLLSIIRISLKIILIITVATMIGIEMTSFIALIGAAGLAVGLALQGSMSNFAGGVLILLFKPFKIGDFIEGNGRLGTVKEIQIFSTILKTPDNKTIIVPNGVLSNGDIVNFSTEDTRRVDLTFGIGYDDDLRKAKDILNGLIKDDSRIMSDPEPFVRVGELGDSSVNFTVRVWTKSEDYWGVFFDLTEKVKLAFDEQGISIPYPQRDVHIYNHENG